MSSIRLSKVVKDLNVGLSTAVDFLRKKGHVVDSNPNNKISDDEYALLVKEFSTDKDLKQLSERETQMRMEKERTHTHAPVGMPTSSIPDPSQKDHLVEKQYENLADVNKEILHAEAVHPAEHVIAPEIEELKIEIAEELLPHLKTVGKIDLDHLNKPIPSKEEIISELVSEEPAFAKPIQVEEASEPEQYVEALIPEVIHSVEPPAEKVFVEEPIIVAVESPLPIVEEQVYNEKKPELEPESELQVIEKEEVVQERPEAEIFQLRSNVI